MTDRMKMATFAVVKASSSIHIVVVDLKFSPDAT